jgi:Amt family ammonium transporter
MSWSLFRKPDISMSLNGVLAGLVGITAGCDALNPTWSLATGFTAGLVVVLSVMFFEKIRVDDPVGAISVHGVCGAWGTVAVGLFATESGLLMGHGPGQLLAQLIGVGVALVWTLTVSFTIFLGIKYTIGLRVSAAEEVEGLDITEHGMAGYHTDMPIFPAASPTPAGTPAAVAARAAPAES